MKECGTYLNIPQFFRYRYKSDKNINWSLLITILNAVLKSNYKISIYSFYNQHNIPETNANKWHKLICLVR